MDIHLGSDHAGFELKQELKNYLAEKGHHVVDHGCYTDERADYPDFAHKVAVAVLNDKDSLGILFCGSANGVAMAANRHKHIRAAVCWETEIAHLSRSHNDANVICLPTRFVAVELAKEMVDEFLKTPFEGGRHQRRVEKIECV